MGAGGIIQDSASRLLGLLGSPCFYSNLSNDDQNKYELLMATGAMGCSAADVGWMAKAVNQAIVNMIAGTKDDTP